MVKRALSKCYVFFIFLFLYAPILVLVFLSFNDSRSRVVWGGFTLQWYEKLFTNQQILSALGTTLLLALLSASIATIIGLMGAVGIDAMGGKQYQVMMLFTNIPLLNADIVTGIALMLWFVRILPLGFTSVLVGHVTFNIPYVILCVLPKLRQVDVSVYEAARDLGAGSVTAFYKIILPNIFSGVMSGFFMAFTMSMDDFVITYFTKGAGVNTLSTMIYGEIRRGIKPEMYALSTIMFFIILLLLLAVNFMPRLQQKERLQKEKALRRI